MKLTARISFPSNIYRPQHCNALQPKKWLWKDQFANSGHNLLKTQESKSVENYIGDKGELFVGQKWHVWIRHFVWWCSAAPEKMQWENWNEWLSGVHSCHLPTLPPPPSLSPPSRRAPHPTSEKVNESESKIRHFHRLLTGWYCFQKLPTYLHTYQPTYHYLSLPLPSSENTLMEHLWPLRHLIRVIRRHDLTTYLIVFSEGVFWTFDNWVVKLLASPGDRISSLFAFFDVFVISNYIYPPLVICICICICICHQQLYLLPIGHLLTQDCERWVDRTDKAFTVLAPRPTENFISDDRTGC